MPTIFILGPSFDNHIEPAPDTAPPPPTPGRRQFAFDVPPTSPGGNVNLKLIPATSPSDSMPINVYAHFVQPVESVPAVDQRTPDWFFKSGAPSASIHAGAVAADGTLKITVPNVKPSLQPYFVQTILEFNA